MALREQTVDALVEAGREALASGRWAQARERFESALERGQTPAAWEGLSWAAWWLGDERATFAAREQAFRRYRAAGDRSGAARMAIWVASDFLDFRGDDALAAGWLQRARRLLAGEPTRAEHGWLSLMEADLVMRAAGDPAEVERLARAGTRIGRQLAVPDLEAVGSGLEGLALVAGGDVAEGMRRLDEASALASAEDFDLALSPGWTLCCMLSACEGVGDVGRADQWCRAMEAMSERLRARNMLGVCRSAYGNVLATGGDWPRAEAELVAAVDDLRASRPAMAAGGLVRLGELRARQGRVSEARSLFEQAGPHPRALVGLGRLALESGDARGAVDAAERVLRRVQASAVLDRLPALELLARAYAALGRFPDADRGADELEVAARRLGTPYLVGRAHLVRAEVAAARGDHEEARRAGEDAVDCLTAGSAPYDCARARVVLAATHSALGRIEAATSEARAARETFAALGASRELEAAEVLLRQEGDGGRRLLGELSVRELEVLQLIAQGLSDAQIAERLVLSPHTVHRHVANIRTKLRLPSRSAAVAYAARAGLLS